MIIPNNRTPLQVDHASLAGRELDPLVEAFTRLGLPPVYGGPHSNGATHMAVLGFPDGSYLELISTLQAGQPSPWWQAAIHQSAGPCAWAVQVHGIQAEARRLAGLGVEVRGPTPLARRRPDGALVEWELAFLGPGEPGSSLPFLIEDRTPRGLRVQPAPAAEQASLLGIRQVVLGVRSLEESTRLFTRLFGWPDPRVEANPGFGARLAAFAGQPVALAEPLERGENPAPLAGNNWLARRLERLGETPCAFILASRDLTETAARLGLPALPASEAQTWFEAPLAWLPLPGDCRVAVQSVN